MKSIHNPSTLSEKFPEIFTPEIMEWIQKEKFVQTTNDSYCYDAYVKNNKLDVWENKCLSTNVKSEKFNIFVYIYEIGIGFDVDYNCGGNYTNYFAPFEIYTFENAYDSICDIIKHYT